MAFAHMWKDLRSALFPRDETDALPVMDGPMMPNRRLDEAQVLGEVLPNCDDLAPDGNGGVFVSAQKQIVQVSGSDLGERRVVATLDHDVSALAYIDGVLYAGLVGAGVIRLQQGREIARLDQVDGRSLRCPTAITALPDGRIAIAEGSSLHLPEQWAGDLLERRALGRIVVADRDLRAGATLLDQLAWPYGLAVSPDSNELWCSESWRHRVFAIPLPGTPSSASREVLRNLPGYPARVYADGGRGYWLSVFAVRTHLLELVLRETRYREPLQGGSIKKLGVTKPWAPPRSYGLVLRLSPLGECLGSLHSRVGGAYHGITAARPVAGRLLVASKGSGRLLALDPGSAP